MLSRVADALFWMSRYLERAEHTARLLDVCFHLELDLHGVLAGPHELHWSALAAILQQNVRADKTLRILDIQYHLLHEMNDPADLSLSSLLWAGVLRSCQAYEAYQKLYLGRVDPERVVELLLLHPDFPRSVRFALESVSRAL